jgi:hypothetical protein
LLDACCNGGVLDSVVLCPLPRRGGRAILVWTGADFVDDGVWNQDCGSEALDQIEPVYAREQNE